MTTEGPFAFQRSSPFDEDSLNWTVSCDGVDCARLRFCRINDRWDLDGIRSLDGRSISWRHNSQPVARSPIAWLRRMVVDTLAAWALDALRASREAA